MNILVVDDENQITSLFQDYLELCGAYKVSTASSGQEALGEIKKRKPDLIILDQVMPGLSGVEVVDELKKNSNTRHIPIIIFSASESATDEEKKDLGILDFLPKPIDFTKLNQILEEVKNTKN
ncbi:MAG: response regulator [Elusimicrobia bacterium]|nr:response regulator [Elusimicrobiota bacterium]